MPTTWLLCSGELQPSCISIFILEILWFLMNLISCFVTILSTAHSDTLLLSRSPYFAARMSVFSSYHNIGFSSAFPRNQSRLCDLCSWWANHHVVFCQIPDSSCLFTWWYSNTPFLVCIKTASFMHQQGEGFCQKRVTLVTETSSCLWNGGEGNGSAGEGKKCRTGVTVLALGVSKK